MANYGSKTITINVDCNTSQAEAKVTSLADSVKRIEKNGKIHLTAEVDKSNLSQLDSLVKDKKIKFSLDADNLKDLKNGLNDLAQHPNLYKSVEKDISRLTASLKNRTRGVFDDLISGENSKELDSITKKIQKLYANPKKFANGDYETTWLTKLKAYMQRYQDLNGDMDATFTSQGGRNKSAKSIVNDLQNSKAYQGYDIGQYSEIMSKLESTYNNVIQKIKQLRKQSLKDLSPESMEELLQMPKFDYNSLNEFYTKAIKQQLTAKQNEVKPQISVEQIRQELTTALMDIPVTLKVDDEIARIKSSLATIQVNLNCDDDIARIRTQIGSTFVNSSEKTITKKKRDNDNLTNTGMQIKLSVTPSVDSVKKSIKSIPKSKTVSINIKTGDSLKNLKQLTQGLNDYDLQGTIQNLKSIGQSFNYAFKNVNQAANAPMKILKDMNNEVLRLKKNLNEVGVKKFSDSKAMNKQLESYKKQAVTEAKNSASEILKEAKQHLSDAKKIEKRNEKLEAKNAKLKQDVTDLKAKHKEELTTLKEGSGEEGSSKKWSEASFKKLSTARDVLKDYTNNDYNVISDVKAELDQCKTTAESIIETFTDKKLGDSITNDERMQLLELDEKIKQIKDYKKAENLILNSNGELIQHQAEFMNGFGNATDVEKIKAITKALKAEGIEAKNVRKVNSQKDMYDYTTRVGDKEVTQRAYLDSVPKPVTKADVRVSTRKVEQYQTAGEKWLSSFKAKFTNLAQYIAGAEIQNQILAQVKQGISFVKEYDSALTNIGMTMQATQGQLQNLGKEAISTGQELGTSATDVIDAAKIYANANETTESVLQKSQATIKLKNASGQDISTVADQVQGVINQFDGMEGQETRIVSSLEKISAGLGIDFAKGISIMSDATQTAGSVANEAGLSFEKYAASVGKISEMTRLEGSTIGNAYKTIMARISRSKSADSDVSDADRSNAAKALASVNISTYDNKGNFKDLEEILDELSGKWNNLTDAQRNYISEQAAGVRNINTFKALMSTWGESKELAQSALDDTSFIDEVQDKYMDSVEGKLNHAKANIQDFFNTIISAGNIGTVVTGFNGITGALNAMIKTAQKLPGIGNTTAKVMTGFIGIASSGLLNSLTKANNELKQDDDLKGKYGIFDVFKKAGSTFKADFKTLGTKENAEGRENGLFSIFKNAFKDYKANASEAVQANNQLGNSLSGLNNNWNATKSAVSATWKSMTGFSKVLTGIGAAMLVWELGSKAFDLMTTSAKEAEEAVGKASTTYKNQTSTLKKNKDAVVSIQDEWSNLSKGVNTNTNENISLTSSEYERYLELNKQIASIIPETISGYDAQGNAILNLKGNVASLNAELEKQEASQAYKRIQDNAKAYQKNSQHVNGSSGWKNEFATYLSKGWDGIKKGSGYYYDEIYGNQKAYNLLKKLSTYTTKDDFAKVQKLFNNGVDGNFTEAYDSKKYLQGMFGNIQSYEEWQKVLKSGDLQAGMSKQQQAIKATAETNKQLLNDYITTLTKGDGEFSKLSDDVSNNIATLLTKTNAKTINKLAAEDNGLQNYALKYFNKIGKSKKAQDALSNLLGIGDETDIKKIQSILENDLDTLSNTLGIDKDKLEIQLDLKGANDAVKAVENVYDNAKKFEKTQKKSEKSSKKELTAKKRLGKYIKDNALHTADQLELLNQCVQNAQSLDEAFRQYETQKYKVEVDMTSLDDLKANLTTVKDEIDAINQAKTNSNSASGMTLDDIQKVKDAYSSLEGYDYSKLFEQTYSGMHLNAQELSKLQSQYEKTEYGKYTDKVTNLQKQYQGLCAAISRTSDASEKYNLIKQRDDISEQISQAKEYQSVFEGMTNSVTKWQNAQSYSLTQDIGSGYEDAKKLFDEGWIGDEKFQAYAQLFTNKDLSGSTSDVYEQVFAQNEGRMQRYFAEGRQGVNNFIQDIAKTVPEAKGLIDEAGNVDWTKMPSVKTLAKAMDLDKSLVDAMFKEMNRAGADLDFSEEADNLREMRDAAVQAGQSFNSLDKLDPDKKLINSDKLSQEQKDFKFDLNATGDSLDDQIESARKLRKALVEAYHEGSDQVKAFDAQLDYLEAKRGAETEQLTQDTREDAQNAINKELNRKQKKQGIKKKDRTQMDVDWDSADASYYQSQADKLLDAISDKEGNIKIKLSDDGGKQALALLNEIQQKEWELSDSNVKVHVDTSQLNKNQQNIVEGFGNIQEAANNLQNLQNNKKRGLPVTKKAIQDAQTEVQKQINDFVAKQPNAAKNLNLSTINGDLGSKKLSKQQKQALQKEINKYAKNVTSGTAGDYLSKMEIKKSAWQDTKKSKKKDKNTTVLIQEVKVKGKDKVDKLKKEINSIKNTDVNLNVKDSRDKDSTKTESKKSSKKETQTKAETQARTKKAEKVVSAYNDFDDLKLSEKQQNVVVKYIADHSDIDKYTPEEKQAIAEYLAGHTDVDSWTPAQKEAVANFIAHHESVDAWTPAEKQALARYLLNSEQPDNYKPGGKDAVVTYSKNSAAVDTYNPPNIVRSVTYTIKTIGSAIAGLFGGHKLNGTAHVNGTAYANGTTGNWGAKQTETALVGEENPELRVDSRTGRWELLGQNGAEFRKINKGDIIFNARQTKDLFEHGYVNGRGKAFLNGTISRAASLFKTSGQAYGNGTWGGGRWNIYTGASSRKPIISTASNVQQAKQAAKQSAAATASDADKFLETMDWIEIKIKRLEDVISDLDAKASSAYRKFSDRNKTLGDEFTKVTEEIQLQKDAYNAYLQKANSIDLAEDYKNKVRNGMLSIEDITDETLKDKIDEFQNWYEKCKECEYALQDLEDKLGDIVKTKFDNINDEFSSQLEIIEHENKLLETQLGIIEGKGMFAGQNYFTSMMKNQEAYVEKLHDQYMSLSEAMYDALDSGKVQEGSSAYYEMIKEINGVSEAWYEAKKQLVDYKNEAYEMDWSIFEKGMEYFSDITDESEFLQNILRVGDNDIFVKETGRFNDKGNAINSLHAMNYGAYMAEADKYKEKVAELNAEIEKDPSNTKLIDKRSEYIKQQREMIQNANGEKKSIHDLVEESYNKMLDILQKLIDKRKDFLQNEKDLYQYSKDIEEQVKSITDIKKQLNALGGDDSEETQSKVQSLKDQLKKAETDLEGSEYDQYITDQEKLLDNLYTQYEEVLNTRLDNIDGLLTDAINHGNENAENVRQTITEASEKVGYDVSEGFNRIWNSTDNGVGRILSEYSTNFLSSMSTITEYLLYIFHKMGGRTKEEAEQDRLKAEAERKRQEELRRQQEEAKKQQQAQQQQSQKNNINQDTIAGIAAAIWCEGNSGWGNDPFRSGKLTEKIGAENARKVQDYINAHGYNGDLYRYWINTLGGNASRFHYSAFKTGGYTGNNEGFAMLHAKERVLNATQTKAFETLVNDFLPDVSKELEKLRAFSLDGVTNKSMNNNISNDISLNLSLPNVSNANDFVKAIQTSRTLQQVIKAITIDEAMGKNTLSKFKY